MNRMPRAAVLLTLLERLKAHGSWCGETHLQKAAYFLQELVGIPLEFNFIFYKHGPYSFDLRDEITALRADQLLDVVPRNPYGPSLCPSANSAALVLRFPRTMERYTPSIEFVATRLGRKTVTELERLATALYVTLGHESASPDERAEMAHSLKKHVSVEDARTALQAVDNMIHERSLEGEKQAHQ